MTDFPEGTTVVRDESVPKPTNEEMETLKAARPHLLLVTSDGTDGGVDLDVQCTGAEFHELVTRLIAIMLANAPDSVRPAVRARLISEIMKSAGQSSATT